jgi:hypothetical protein
VDDEERVLIAEKIGQAHLALRHGKFVIAHLLGLDRRL